MAGRTVSFALNKSSSMTDNPTRFAIRPLAEADLPAIAAIAAAHEMFPPEMLPDMTAVFLAASDANAADEIWTVAALDGSPVGFCYAVPEQLAAGTWNMLALAVSPDHQGIGIGATLTNDLERRLRERGDVRILIVDTSGTDRFAPTRRFYEKQYYEPEARIRDYWAEGDDKVTFRKAL